jgi:hypothetical protein
MMIQTIEMHHCFRNRSIATEIPQEDVSLWMLLLYEKYSVSP